jgi:hypothetical protein
MTFYLLTGVLDRWGYEFPENRAGVNHSIEPPLTSRWLENALFFFVRNILRDCVCFGETLVQASGGLTINLLREKSLAMK